MFAMYQHKAATQVPVDCKRVRKIMRQFLSATLMAVMTFAPLMDAPAAAAANPATVRATAQRPTATPIKHLVVIFNENISFDHYFGTYPNATNPAGEPKFKAKQNTPTVNGLSGAVLVNNPNLNPANGTGATNPFRLDRSQAGTADQNHAYGPEQSATHMGLLDLYPVSTGTAGPPPNA